MNQENVYYVLWTYFGNYSDKPIIVKAGSPAEAADNATQLYGEDFHKNATVYVFSGAPACVIRRGEME